MLCWSLQRSCTTEPVTAPLGTSQDGVCGGTRGQRNGGIKRKKKKKKQVRFIFRCFYSYQSSAALVPRTLRVTLVSPKVTVSNGALISQRYSPASSWVTLFKVTVAPSMVARPSKEPEGHISMGLPKLQLNLLLTIIIHIFTPFYGP